MTAARTADRIVAGRLAPAAADDPMARGVDGLRRKLADRSLPVIVADNVQAYTLAQAEKGNEFRVGSWPCLAPPWDWAFIEYPSPSGRQRRGAHVIGFDLDSLAADELAELDGMIGAAIDDGRSNYPDAHVRFALALLMFVDDGRLVHGPIGSVIFALDEHGKELGNRWYYRDQETWARAEIDTDEQGTWLLAAALPALQTIAFMHCRNVIVDRAQRPAALAKKYRRKTGLDPVRWQTVRLELPRKAGTGGSGSGPGVAPDLHIVTGHFAHYGNCCPSQHEPNGLLFGRLEGIYWMPQHLRGDPAREVRTDRIAHVSDPG